MEAMTTVSNYLHNQQKRSYTSEEKSKLLDYMKRRDFLDWASTKKITDRVTGERVDTVCWVGYNDGEYEWTSTETYLLEKYDLKVSDEFIQHVMGKNKG